MKRKNYISDSATKAPIVEFAIFATPNGFLVAPTFAKAEKKQIINYDLFYEDIFFNDESSVLKRIEEEIVEKNRLEKCNISIIWGEDVDKVISDVVCTNAPICNQFDRE